MPSETSSLRALSASSAPVLDAEEVPTDHRRRVVNLGCPDRTEARAICGWRKPTEDTGAEPGSPVCEVCLSIAHTPRCPDCGADHYAPDAWGVPLSLEGGGDRG